LDVPLKLTAKTGHFKEKGKRQPAKRKTKSLKTLQINTFSIKRLKGKDQTAKGDSTKSMKSVQINTCCNKILKKKVNLRITPFDGGAPAS